MLAGDEGGDAFALIAFGDGCAGPVEKRFGEVDVEDNIGIDLALNGCRLARVVDDQRDAHRLIKVRPLALEAAFGEVVAVVGGVDDDGVFIEAKFFEFIDDASDFVVDTGDHAVVGAEVDLIFFGGVVAPEVALAVDRLFEEFGMSFVDGVVAEAWLGDGDVFVHAVGGFGPLIVIAGASVAIFGVGGVEPEAQIEGLTSFVAIDEFESSIGDELDFVSGGAIGLWFEIGMSGDGF